MSKLGQWFRRDRGEGEAAEPPPAPSLHQVTQPALAPPPPVAAMPPYTPQLADRNARTEVRLPRGTVSCHVAGVLARQSVVQTLPLGPVHLELRREPFNVYDRNAVAVHLLDGRQVGYLGAWIAAEHATVIEQLSREGRVTVEGVVERWEKGLGIELNLVETGYLKTWAAAGAAQRDRMPIASYTVKLSGSTDCQAGILAALDGSTGDRRRKAKVVPVEVTSGKYRGWKRLDLYYGGHLLGSLLPTRREKFPALFEAAERGDHHVWVTAHFSSSGVHRIMVTLEGR